MTTYTITAPSKLDGDIVLPASKSISNRALVICALAGCHDKIENLSDCDDTEVVIRALETMSHDIDVMAAGTAMRFMTAFLATLDGHEHLITGTERMKHRPIGILVDALRMLGADISYVGEEGFPPLLIRGRQLEGGLVEAPGNVSSQFVSALLLIGPMLKNGLVLRLHGDIISKPYIELTLWNMREFGAHADWTGAGEITVWPEPYRQRSYFVESDWSAASYWYEMVALSDDPDASVRLEGLMDGSKQGDSHVRYLFSMLGVKTTFGSRETGRPTTVTLKKSGRRSPRIDFDFSGSPDLAQTFVVTCALLGVPFHFRGLQTLRIKETDRIAALKKEMQKMGFRLQEANGSELIWNGEREPAAADFAIDTYEDHRMALAFAPAALKSGRPLRINNPQVVSKSYPNFWNDLRQMGFNVSS